MGRHQKSPVSLRGSQNNDRGYSSVGETGSSGRANTKMGSTITRRRIVSVCLLLCACSMCDVNCASVVTSHCLLIPQKREHWASFCFSLGLSGRAPGLPLSEDVGLYPSEPTLVHPCSCLNPTPPPTLFCVRRASID